MDSCACCPAVSQSYFITFTLYRATIWSERPGPIVLHLGLDREQGSGFMEVDPPLPSKRPEGWVSSAQGSQTEGNRSLTLASTKARWDRRLQDKPTGQRSCLVKMSYETLGVWSQRRKVKQAERRWLNPAESDRTLHRHTPPNNATSAGTVQQYVKLLC